MLKAKWWHPRAANAARVLRARTATVVVLADLVAATADVVLAVPEASIADAVPVALVVPAATMHLLRLPQRLLRQPSKQIPIHFNIQL